ncbi:prolyl oligopeptidase family serine peptidase [Secundilactobacillus similis]|nr:prolyl oligopeptidase family serine peptidase [Secundilactobacillus similis]
MKVKWLLTLPILMLGLGLAACSTTQSKSSASSSSSGNSAKKTSQTTMTKTSTDDSKADGSLKTVLSETKSKFKQLSYKDTKTGVTLKYNLYVPENYNKNKAYPLVSFIHDDSVTGKSTVSGLTQGYGGVIWATPSEQAKHASFVVDPVFSTSTVSGGMGQSGSAVVKKQVQTYLDLLKSLEKQYNIDQNRLYGTGQSMGGMTMFYLNSHYPKLFAATLYVSSQWDVKQLAALKHQKFFYIVAGGDSTAVSGQNSLIKYLKQSNVAYTHRTLSATASAKTKNQVINQMLAKKANANFITWTSGSVLTNSQQAMEHMASFDYGYTVPSVRDWLFNQRK